MERGVRGEGRERKIDRLLCSGPLFSTGSFPASREMLFGLRRDIRQAELRKIVAFAAAHFLRLAWVLVIVATEVQKPVNHVKCQLRRDRVAPVGRLGAG